MFNYNLIQKGFNQKAKQIRQLEFIIHEVASRMVERLDYIKIKPKAILDIGYGLGVDFRLLESRYPDARIYGIDLAVEMLKLYPPNGYKKTFLKRFLRQTNNNLICGNAINLPISLQSVDLVWSNLLLPYISDIKNYFQEINRVLKIGGMLLITGLGVDSLKQIRDLGLATIDFPDMHLIGDVLLDTGFANPVTDVEYIKLEYDSLSQLLTDIRLVGNGSILGHQISRDDYVNLNNKFIELTDNGKFPLTLEVFYAHAWKDQVRQDLIPGQSIMQFHRKK